MGYPPIVFEEALYKLWELVENRLAPDEVKALATADDNADRDQVLVADAFEHLRDFGRGGPVGIGIGRFGGHALG